MYKIINPNTKEVITSFDTLKQARFYIRGTLLVIEYSQQVIALINRKKIG